MKGIIVLALACMVAPPAVADLYKYVDKDGRTVYSDQPPPNVDSKQMHISPGGGSTSKSYVARDKELDKGRAAEKDKEKKKEVAEQNAKLDQERCAQAKLAYQTYTDAGRLFKYNDKGEREMLDDDQIEAERAKAKQQMDEACKTS
jgi:hypothetical protein